MTSHSIRYAKAERVLMAYLKGKHISYLRVVSSELFPLPEETHREAAGYCACRQGPVGNAQARVAEGTELPRRPLGGF